MTDNELRKLSRAELLELLIGQVKENEALRAQLEAAKAELEDRRIAIEEAGSLAQAALQLNQVFAAADAAAEQYMFNLKADGEQRVRRMEEETRRKCEEMLAQTEKRCKEAENKTLAWCREKIGKTGREDGHELQA